MVIGAMLATSSLGARRFGIATCCGSSNFGGGAEDVFFGGGAGASALGGVTGVSGLSRLRLAPDSS